jgi:hypothetical protein
MPTQKPKMGGEDRRRRSRFPIATELRYEVRVKNGSPPLAGVGQVQDISSEAVAFRTNWQLEPNTWLQASMSWPDELENQPMLRIEFEGPVLRTSNGLVVVAISRYEFRTAYEDSIGAREEVQHLTQAFCVS